MITIGLPFFNSRATLLDAVRSVFAQTWQDWRLILVDDGSTDGGVRLVSEISDNRVEVICDGVCRGLASRLNQIAGKADTPYLARMDSDDLMHPDRLRNQMEFLTSHRDVDVVGTAVVTTDRDLTPFGVRSIGPLRTDIRSALSRALFEHPTVAGKTSWFRTHPYDTNYVRAEDRELWVRSVGESKFGKLVQPLYFYREVGAFNQLNYCSSCATDRRIIARYGPRCVGLTKTLSLMFGSHLKEKAYRIACAFLVEDFFIRRRSVPLDPRERAAMARIITGIRSTKLPGIS